MSATAASLAPQASQVGPIYRSALAERSLRSGWGRNRALDAFSRAGRAQVIRVMFQTALTENRLRLAAEVRTGRAA